MLRIVVSIIFVGLPGLLFSQTDDPAARLRVFAPGQTSAALEQAWFQFNTVGHTAPIRAMCFSEDSKYLYTAGEDKVVRFWDIDKMQETKCVRWRVGRENWGTIHAVAQRGQTVAFAGQAANMWMQEIWIVNAKTGEYQTILRPETPGECIKDIVFLDSDHRLASLQANGTVEIWEHSSTDWKKILTPHSADELWLDSQLPKDMVKSSHVLHEIKEERRSTSLTFFQNRYIVYPVPQNPVGDNRTWKLAFYDLSTEQERIHPFDFKSILSITTDEKGDSLLIADQSNQIYEWSDNNQKSLWGRSPTILKSVDQTNSIGNLSVSSDGSHLILGTERNNQEQKQTYLYRWIKSASKWKELSPIETNERIDVCQINADGQYLAFSQNGKINLLSWETPNEEPKKLVSIIQPVLQVAFSNSSYRMAIRKQSAGTWNTTFDPKRIQFDTNIGTMTEKWQPVHGLINDSAWKLMLEKTPQGNLEYHVLRNGSFFSRLPIDPRQFPIADRQVDTRNILTALWWFSDLKGEVQYLLAGTSGVSHDIFAFKLEKGICPIVRRFRGHSASATSLSVSSDRRYMVSSSLDSTIRFWSLQDLDTVSPIEQRFGMKLRMETDKDNVVVESITEDSPLFIRGVRKDYRLKRIMVSDASLKSRYIVDPREMLTNIAEVDWQKQIGFEFESIKTTESSDGTIPPFAVSPTRREIAALAIFDDTSDFAYWTPFGYYTASADGSHCFGWLYNRGLRGIPEFIAANSFKNSLENRPLMMRLLDAGSLEGAWNKLKTDTATYVPTQRIEGKPVMQTSSKPTPKPQQPPPPTEPPIVIAPPRQLTYNALLAGKPSIEILLPKTREELAANSIHIEAKACFPKQEKPLPPKLFTNGIRAGEPSKIIDESDSALPDIRFVKYVWDNVPLPADPYVQVKMTLESEKRTFMASDDKIAVRNGVAPPPRPKMYLVLLGTDYTDIKSEFPELPGVKNTIEKVHNTIKNSSGRMYDVEVFSYLNESATLKNWRSFVENFKKNRMSEVRPDDLFVVYLAGHGSLDPRSGRYYFAMFDTKYDDYCKFKYDHSLSFDDILPLAEIPCRRVVMLETCQFSPHELEDPLKDYRRLEDEQFLLLLAAEPGRSAVWTDNDTIGRFSKYLIEGWQGSADGFDPIRRQIVGNEKDGKITFAENYSYLVDRLRSVNRSTMERQMAEIFGKDLLRYIDIPLSEDKDCPAETRGVRVIVAPRKPLGNIAEISAQ